MLKRLLLGSLLGGLTAFIWTSLSWELLPWHESSLRSFQDEDGLAAAITAHTTESGTYLLPGAPIQPGLTAEQKKAAQTAQIEKMQKGPIMFAAVLRSGFDSFARAIVIQFVSLVAAAFLLTWLLLQTNGLSYTKRVAFLAVVGLAAGIIVEIPNWNWWGFSGAYTAVNIVDFALTWLLAGLVIAKVANPQPSASHA